MEQGLGYSNRITYNLIVKKLLEDGASTYKKKLYISQGIKHLTDGNLLNEIIIQLSQNNLVDYHDEVVLKFRKELVERNYSEDINTKLRAEFLSIFLDYDVRTSYLTNFTNQERPKLNIKIRRKQLIHDYEEIFKYIKKQYVIFHNKKISKLPLDEQIKQYKTVINQTTLFHYENDCEDFKDELNLFEKLLNNIVKEHKESLKKDAKLKHPFIVLNAEELFKEYVSKHIIEPYADYSYLFQRLLHEKFITKLTHNQFTNWLAEKELINDRVKDMFINKEGFRSLKKSFSTQRENNFNIVFKKLL